MNGRTYYFCLCRDTWGCPEWCRPTRVDTPSYQCQGHNHPPEQSPQDYIMKWAQQKQYWTIQPALYI